MDENGDAINLVAEEDDDGLVVPALGGTQDDADVLTAVSPNTVPRLPPTVARASLKNASVMRASRAGSLRASLASLPPPLPQADPFQREVFDVHHEIDKLLGGLKVELDHWRSEFQTLQVYWFSRVMRIDHDAGADADGSHASSEDLRLRNLFEFQCLLERHVEETELDLQDLEERLQASETDRAELQKLLEEGSHEVHTLEVRLRQRKTSHRARARSVARMNEARATASDTLTLSSHPSSPFIPPSLPSLPSLPSPPVLQREAKHTASALEQKVASLSSSLAQSHADVETLERTLREATERHDAAERRASRLDRDLKAAHAELLSGEGNSTQLRKEVSDGNERIAVLELEAKRMHGLLEAKVRAKWTPSPSLSLPLLTPLPFSLSPFLPFSLSSIPGLTSADQALEAGKDKSLIAKLRAALAASQEDAQAALGREASLQQEYDALALDSDRLRNEQETHHNAGAKERERLQVRTPLLSPLPPTRTRTCTRTRARTHTHTHM